jgi:hypothetical protein
MAERGTQFRQVGRAALFSLLGFIIIFPGFFAYAWLTSLGVLPSALGGYVPQAAFGVSMFLLLFGGMLRKRLSGIDVVFWVFIVFLIFVVTANTLGSADDSLAKSYASALFQWLSLYYLFKHLGPISLVRAPVISSFVFMVVFVYFNMNFGVSAVFSVDYAQSDRVAPTYQDFALYFLVCALAIASFTSSGLGRLLVFIVTIATLLVLGARSELVGGVVGLIAVELMRRGFLRTLVVLVFAVAPLLLIGYRTMATADIEKNRTLLWIESLTETGELFNDDVRTAANAKGWETIKESPIFGDFGNYASGEYAHNVLSVWVDFGLLGLALFLAAVVVPLRQVVRYRAVFEPEISQRVFCLSVFLVSILLIMTSKSFGYPMIPVALGLSASLTALPRQLVRSSASKGYPRLLTNAKSVPRPLG